MGCCRPTANFNKYSSQEKKTQYDYFYVFSMVENGHLLIHVK